MWLQFVWSVISPLFWLILKVNRHNLLRFLKNNIQIDSKSRLKRIRKAIKMKKFSFSGEPAPRQVATFSGYDFYTAYKGSEFLRNSENIETILSKGYELRKSLKNIIPGETIMVESMTLEKKTPLLIKKTGPGITVEEYEFTYNRLSGIVAAYTYENRLRFPIINSSEATALGLTWDHTNTKTCKLYLSAVSGTEHFYAQFTFWPLICALRKLQLKKITPEIVIKMAKIKNKDGHRVAKVFMANIQEVKQLWLKFPSSSLTDLDRILAGAPQQLKNVFFDHQ